MQKFLPGNKRKTYYPKDRSIWRTWLKDNYNSSPGIWLIYYKKHTGKQFLTYAEAVEEALCFGWIDNTMNPLDEDRYMQFFSPRKLKSSWSALNKQRVKKLIKNKLMTRAGLLKIRIAKKNGSWTRLDDVEALQLPDDFKKALAKNAKALKYFEAFSRSSKKGILHRLKSAKREETRKKRIEETILLASQNLQANDPEQRKRLLNSSV